MSLVLFVAFVKLVIFFWNRVKDKEDEEDDEYARVTETLVE